MVGFFQNGAHLGMQVVAIRHAVKVLNGCALSCGEQLFTAAKKKCPFDRVTLILQALYEGFPLR